jgi:hypothetical protein
MIYLVYSSAEVIFVTTDVESIKSGGYLDNDVQVWNDKTGKLMNEVLGQDLFYG